jgi:feruloyl-CoA synthase
MPAGARLRCTPVCPTARCRPAYSTVSQDFDKLRHVLTTLTPGLVFAADAARYGKAIAGTVGTDDVRGGAGQRATRAFQSLLATTATPAVDAAMQATGPDTIVKFLFTSGSTKLPKAVINTQRMWCANQQQMRQSMPVLAEEPPVLVDWLPWNHTFGGNHNFGMDRLQRRHAVHRRRQAHAGADGRDPAQPARDRPHRCTSTCPPASRRSPTP